MVIKVKDKKKLSREGRERWVGERLREKEERGGRGRERKIVQY